VDARYLTAFLSPKKHKVAGVYLDAFCCRHMITLEALKSPFSSNNPENKTPSVFDLIIAIRVCSTPNWYDATSNIPLSQKLRFNLLTLSIVSQANAFQEFVLYMKESMSVPKIWVSTTGSENTQKKKKEKIPPTLSLVTLLMTKFNFSEEDAWNMPFSRAIWYSIGFASQESGEIDVISTDEEDRVEKDKAELEEIEKKAKEAIKR
jgi:hypothetical protein